MATNRGDPTRWFFTREQLENTPSRRHGVEPDRELSYRQQAANLVQDMGQRLNVSQLTINTAIVYMHRFYMHHSFTKFHRNAISPTTLFLAAKVEEQPRKLEYVIKVAHACLNPQESPLDTKSNAYLQQAQELVILESIVLQTLGFEITIDHPHTDVVKCSQLVRASKDLAQTSYFMATNSLHLTTFCLQYKPTVIACVCIHLACKWSNWEIPVSTDGKHWWVYVDSSVTHELLDELTHDFLQILEKTPSRLKRIRNWRATQAAKKPKSENIQLSCTSLAGSSILQDQRDNSLAGLPSSFSKAGDTFTMSAPSGGALSLDSITGIYQPPSHSEWPQGNQSQIDYASGCIKQELFNTSHKEHQNPSTFKTQKTAVLNIVKQELKGASLSGPAKHQPPTSSSYTLSAQPLPPQVSLNPKLSLDKYREKHTVEVSVSGHKGRQEQHATPIENNTKGGLSSSNYAPSVSRADHLNSQTSQISHNAHCLGSSSTASTIKNRLSAAMDRRHHSDKWDKNSLNLHLAIPGSGGSSKIDKNKEEFKMKIKVSSSERHSSSDEGMSANNKNKHSSPIVSKEKPHRSVDHNLHRHHKFSHHSGNGQGGSEGPNSGGDLLRGPPELITIEGIALPHSGPTALTSSSQRKRAHLEANHNQHPPAWSSTSNSKLSKISKGGTSAAGGLRTSQQCLPPSEPAHEVGNQRH
ncbi:cyclin-T2-like isoform X1 [Nerophis ophidion]|uniref:cyclin-T2-like isoform X1 n=2 Tax=Nerophis ophidion TaxID=159077 RepID=UPI002AE06FC9|nr:cyclin-T2-like isoform X1 [Nerophis ophidion]